MNKRKTVCQTILGMFCVIVTMLFIAIIIVLHERVVLALVYSFIIASIIFIGVSICFPVYQMCYDNIENSKEK